MRGTQTTRPGASDNSYKLRTCRSTDRQPTNCPCQSIGLAWPPKMMFYHLPVHSPSSGGFPGKAVAHTLTRMHRPRNCACASLQKVAHLPVYPAEASQNNQKLRTCQPLGRGPPKATSSHHATPHDTTHHSTPHHSTTPPHHHTTQHHTTPHRTTTPQSTHHATTQRTTTHHTTHNSNASNSCAFASVWGGGRGDHLPAAISLDFAANGLSDHHLPRAITLRCAAAADHLPGAM